MKSSLRRGLLVSLLSTSFLIWGITGYKSYREARHEVEELFDAELSQSARVLLAMINSAINEDELPPHGASAQLLDVLGGHTAGHKYEKKLAFQLWNPAGDLLIRSSSAPHYPISRITSGFSRTTIDNNMWHVFSMQDDMGRFTVHVGQRDDIRGELTDDITHQLLKQFLLGPPLMAVVIWFLVGHALAPLNRLAQEVKGRKGNLLTPLVAKKIPNEVAPLVDAVNSLLLRLQQTFENERRFTADASHELRTPLAGLKTQCQVALRAKDDETRNAALNHIEKAVERMTHMVHQLLTMARVDPESGLSEFARLDLHQQALNLIVEIEPGAHQKNIELSLECSDAVLWVDGNASLLDTLMRNLLDNAIRYTPANGRVVVTLSENGQGTTFCIDDSGPGISRNAREKVFQRFYRGGDNVAVTEGSGLGLSIVSRIAALHGAVLNLDRSPLGGLRVCTRFPASQVTVAEEK